MAYPSYLNLNHRDWEERINKAWRLLNPCRVCPHKCRVNRLKTNNGFCRVGKDFILASYHPHFGEESVLVGAKGSGTIFLAHCNLACVYCQNYDISQLDIGEKVMIKKFAEVMLNLQNMGCHNINFVSPTPYVPQILKALPEAIKLGLNVPLVYNTNCYDAVSTLKLLEGVVDIYMPDAKYGESRVAEKYSAAENYVSVMQKALKEMHRQVGDLVVDKNGIAKKGLLVRHLVLPDGLSGTKKVVEFITKEISRDTAINIMDQYRPMFKAGRYPKLSQFIKPEEYEEAQELARKAGLHNLL